MPRRPVLPAGLVRRAFADDEVGNAADDERVDVTIGVGAPEEAVPFHLCGDGIAVLSAYETEKVGSPRRENGLAGGHRLDDGVRFPIGGSAEDAGPPVSPGRFGPGALNERIARLADVGSGLEDLPCLCLARPIPIDLCAGNHIAERDVLDPSGDADEQDNRRREVCDGTFHRLRRPCVTLADRGRQSDLPHTMRAIETAAFVDGPGLVYLLDRIGEVCADGAMLDGQRCEDDSTPTGVLWLTLR